MNTVAKPVILTIDDEKTVRQSICNYLRDYDYIVLEAPDGSKGLEIIHEKHPDLVLVDLRMPVVDGLDVLRETTRQYPEMPILVVSGTGSIPDVIEALHLGAWDYILKPIQDLSVMAHAIEKNLERARLILENRNYQQHLEEEVQRRTQALRDSEATLRVLLDAQQYISCLIDLEGTILAINTTTAIYLNGPSNNKEDYVGKNIFNFFEEDQAKKRKEDIQQLILTNAAMKIEEHINERYFETTLHPVHDLQGNCSRVAIFANDLTDRIQADRQKERDLREKEMLLKEIHHRVKNNLQVISSLLSLQSRHVTNKDALAMFIESRGRVRSMALVHELLYGSHDIAHIDFSEYIDRLTSALFKAYHTDAQRIQISIDVKGVSLGIDLAIPCGLIINELTSNALKHAFPENLPHEGRIHIRMRELKNGNIELFIGDNGIGLPEDLDIRKSNSLGLHLVTLLSEEQLQGVLTVESVNGCAYTIEFPQEWKDISKPADSTAIDPAEA